MCIFYTHLTKEIAAVHVVLCNGADGVGAVAIVFRSTDTAGLNARRVAKQFTCSMGAPWAIALDDAGRAKGAHDEVVIYFNPLKKASSSFFISLGFKMASMSAYFFSGRWTRSATRGTVNVDCKWL